MILVFSIAMGANYTFYVKTIDTHACAFLTLNILAIGRVKSIRYIELKAEIEATKSFESLREKWTNIYKSGSNLL